MILGESDEGATEVPGRQVFETELFDPDAHHVGQRAAATREVHTPRPHPVLSLARLSYPMGSIKHMFGSSVLLTGASSPAGFSAIRGNVSALPAVRFSSGRRTGAGVRTVGAMLSSQLVVESCLPPSPLLLVGDPVVLAGAGDPPEGGGVVVDGAAGRYLAIRRPDRRPFVWVAGTGSTVDDLSVVFHPDRLEEPLEYHAEIDCPSGRLVVGPPEAVRAWGPDVEPDDHLCAQARAYRPGRCYCGLIVVALVPSGRHPVFTAGDDDAISAVTVGVSAADLRLAG